MIEVVWGNRTQVGVSDVLLVGVWAYSDNDWLKEICVLLISVPVHARVLQDAG